ncbi:MAG: transcription antitermination factor NusB [Planctomycetaceae bacterium]|jgi:transcription antitermination factor NusB|nr:transcription antitermination factor NusB [Planctomycetaceae bacterium]
MEAINDIADYESSKYGNRILARAVAFQVLYQNDLNPDSRKDLTEEFLDEELPEHDAVRQFAYKLIDGVGQNRETIDTKLQQSAHNWTLERMSAIDRNILRLAIYELFYMDTPSIIVINEAIEMAKKFSSKDSAAFVNGILDKLKKTKKEKK